MPSLHTSQNNTLHPTQTRTYLGGVDQLISQALGDGLDVAERGLTGTRAQQPDGLVDAAQGRHIDGLATDGAGAANAGRVFAGARVLDGVHQDLDRVLTRQQVDDLEAVLDDAHGHELLAVVAAVHHHGVDQALDDRALGLAETLGGIAAGRVGQVRRARLDRQVVDQRDIRGLDIVQRPLAEQLDLGGVVEDLLLLLLDRHLLFVLDVSHVCAENGMETGSD